MHIEKFQIHRLKIHFFVSRLICCSLLADMYSCLYNYLLTYLITYTFIRFLSDLPKWTFDWRPRKLSWIINFKKILLHEKQFDGFSHCVIGERCHKTTAARIALEASSIAFFFLSLFKPKGRTEKFVKLVCARSRTCTCWARRLLGPHSLARYITKTRQKWNSKYLWKWRIAFMPATIWQILNVKLMHDRKRKLCESAEICLGKFVKSHLRELIFGGF